MCSALTFSSSVSLCVGVIRICAASSSRRVPHWGQFDYSHIYARDQAHIQKMLSQSAFTADFFDSSAFPWFQFLQSHHACQPSRSGSDLEYTVLCAFFVKVSVRKPALRFPLCMLLSPQVLLHAALQVSSRQTARLSAHCGYRAPVPVPYRDCLSQSAAVPSV